MEVSQKKTNPQFVIFKKASIQDMDGAQQQLNVDEGRWQQEKTDLSTNECASSSMK